MGVSENVHGTQNPRTYHQFPHTNSNFSICNVPGFKGGPQKDVFSVHQAQALGASTSLSFLQRSTSSGSGPIRLDITPSTLFSLNFRSRHGILGYGHPFHKNPYKNRFFSRPGTMDDHAPTTTCPLSGAIRTRPPELTTQSVCRRDAWVDVFYVPLGCGSPDMWDV